MQAKSLTYENEALLKQSGHQAPAKKRKSKTLRTTPIVNQRRHCSPTLISSGVSNLTSEHVSEMGETQQSAGFLLPNAKFRKITSMIRQITMLAPDRIAVP